MSDRGKRATGDTAGPDVTKLSPALVRWLDARPPDERRTVVLRTLAASALSDPEGSEVADLRRTGSVLESAGAGAATVVVTPRSLTEISRLSWVSAVDEPRRLDLAELFHR